MATAKSVSKVKQSGEAKPALPTAASKQAAPAAAPKPVVAKKAKPPVVAKKVAEPAAPAPKAKPAKDKLVRDSFTMPRSDFALIDQLKEKALGFKRPTKKSELLRAGLHVLAGLTDAKLKAALGALVPLKLGRPPRDDQ